jgi:glucose uptake protein
MLGGGAVATLVAVIFGYLAYQGVFWARLEAAIQAGKTKSTRKSISTKSFILSVLGGLFMAGFFPLYDMARVPDLGMGPYTAAFLASLSILLSTFVFNLFFMNLPVQGKPAEFGNFFKGTGRSHLLGFAGGALWALGAVAHYVAARSEAAALPQPVYQYLVLGLPGVIAALLGLTVWNELEGSEGKVRTFSVAMIVLLLAGVVLTSLGPAGPK